MEFDFLKVFKALFAALATSMTVYNASNQSLSLGLAVSHFIILLYVIYITLEDDEEDDE